MAIRMPGEELLTCIKSILFVSLHSTINIFCEGCRGANTTSNMEPCITGTILCFDWERTQATACWRRSWNGDQSELSVITFRIGFRLDFLVCIAVATKALFLNVDFATLFCIIGCEFLGTSVKLVLLVSVEFSDFACFNLKKNMKK